MPIVSTIGGAWADLLDPIVKFNAQIGFGRRASMISMLFNVQQSSRAYEDVSGFGVIGPDAWMNYKNSGQVSEADFDQGYKTRYTHVEYPIDFSVERKTIDDADFANVTKLSQRIGDSANVKREYDAASVFNNAFSSSFLGADGVALCSNSHPVSPTKTGTTQDNNHVLTLTKDNVATIREGMMAFTDDAGSPMAITPDMILVPPALEDEALEISKSLLDPTSANNTVNTQAGRFKVVVWHYLTDSNAWFMIDSNAMKMGLDWYDRVPFSVDLRDGDDRTLRSWWRAYMRYSFGFSSWAWIAGSNPS